MDCFVGRIAVLPRNDKKVKMQYYVYILFSKPNGTLYVGVTSDLIKRIYEHKNKLCDGFAKKYGIDKLGYYEIHGSIQEAIKREKVLKGSSRQRKIAMILENNGDWKDLYDGLLS